MRKAVQIFGLSALVVVFFGLVACDNGSDDPADVIDVSTEDVPVDDKDVPVDDKDVHGFCETGCNDTAPLCEPETTACTVPDAIDEEVPVVDLGPDYLKRLEGTVLDADGNPIVDLFVQPCTYVAGEAACHKAKSNSLGEFVLELDPPRQISALHIRFVTDVFTPLNCHYDLADMPMENNVAVFTEPFVLRAMPEAGVLVPMEVDVPVELAGDGLSVTVSPDDWLGGVWEDTTVRIMAYPLDLQTPCFIHGDNMPDGLYAMTPDWLGFQVPGGLEVKFDNTAGLAPGDQVDLFVVGGLDTSIKPLDGSDHILVGTGAEYPLGTGTVNEDGSKIVSDPGAGMPGLGWIGWRKK